MGGLVPKNFPLVITISEQSRGTATECIKGEHMLAQNYTKKSYSYSKRLIMNWIQVFIQIAVSILLLEFAGASPVGSVSVRSAHGHLTNSSSSSVCDTTHPYCCKPPLTALSLSQLYDELNIVIDLVDPACTDKAFRKNVSVYNTECNNNCVIALFYYSA